MQRFTPRQKRILEFIEESLKVNGYAPSYREIADHFGLTSPATVFGHIKALEDKGYLRVAPGKRRGLEVVREGAEGMPSLELPLVGLITAGQPIEAIEERETISVPADFVRSENSFVLKVKGESMIEEGIFDGDYVVCERSYYPKNGDVVVALLDNAYATLKKYFREQRRIRLQPANRTMKPIYATNPAIQGIVRAVIRKFGYQ